MSDTCTERKRGRRSNRFTRQRILLGGCVAALSLGIAACGGSGDSSESAGGSGGESGAATKVSFVYAGPIRDGGFNESISAIAKSVDEMPDVEVTNTDNIPFTDRAARVLDQLVATGTDVIIDAAGVADQTISVCESHPDVSCLTVYPQGDLPENVGGWSYDWWNQEYAQGVAAGLTMKEDPDSTNTIGYVQSFEIPLTFSVVNANLLGCQSVNPDCKIRLININSYYDPPGSTQAAETLADAGVDILNTWVNDTSVCQVAERRGLPTFGHYYDYSASCPKSMVRSALQLGEDWFKSQVESMAGGDWKAETPILPLKPGNSWFSEWGPEVAKGIQEETDAVVAQLESGDLDPFVGPIKDQKGKVRIKEGEAIDPEVLYAGWDWYVEGVIASAK